MGGEGWWGVLGGEFRTYLQGHSERLTVWMSAYGPWYYHEACTGRNLTDQVNMKRRLPDFSGRVTTIPGGRVVLLLPARSPFGGASTYFETCSKELLFRSCRLLS